MKEELRSYKEAVTAKLVTALEKGTVPWHKPWRSVGAPFNAVSGRPYSGINTLVLRMQGLELDDGADPRWCTYKQASDNGWQVKRGSKGTRVTLWKPLTLTSDEDGQEVKTILMQKLFTVFHASQIEGIGAYEPEVLSEIESNDKAEALLFSSGADIRHGGDKACYDPSEDCIRLPEKRSFYSAAGYYTTAMHELMHWTGHKTRLNRDLSGKRGTSSYAREELVAELGSMFVSGLSGIAQEGEVLENHASYIGSWLRSLKEDANYVFKVSAEASRAAEFVCHKEGAE